MKTTTSSSSDQPRVWYRAPDMTLKKAGLIFGVLFSIVVTIQSSPVGFFLENDINRRVDFFLRLKLGKEPALDPRIKIFIFDDFTAARLGRTDLSLDEWADLYGLIDQKKPAAIFTDKVFGLVPAEENIGNFIRKMNHVKARNVVGGFFSESRIRHREAYTHDSNAFSPILLGQTDATPPAWMIKTPGFIYGPSLRFVNAFSNFGHLNYGPMGMIAPIIRFENDRMIPHWSLWAADHLRLQNDGLYANGMQVPIDVNGFTQPNLIDVRTLVNRSFSLVALKEKKSTQDRIQKGDYVVIIPMGFTGNADFKETWLGKMYGGFIMTSMLNSVLTGGWLTPVEGMSFVLFFFMLLAATCALFLPNVLFLSAMLIGSLAVFAFATYGFAYGNYTSPWLVTLLAGNLSGFTVFFERVRCKENRINHIKRALSGIIPHFKLSELVKNIDKLELEASEQIVSIMFIDIVEYSETAEDKTPKQVFNNLKQVLANISDIIHEHHGVVDKVLGDGIMCYFGFSFDGKKSTSSHADQALACAIKIQQNHFQNVLSQSSDTTQFSNPIRIGINTGAVFMGDLGGQHKIDLTLIGKCVNFAKRLETSCDPFKIMFGATTFDSLSSVSSSTPGLKRRTLSIKHHDELFEAYEFNPSLGSDADLKKVQQLFRKNKEISRAGERFPMTDAELIRIICDASEGQVQDFSVLGLGIEFDRYFARGVQLNIELQSTDSSFENDLQKAGITVLLCEVRWARETTNNLFHTGLKIRNLNDKQADLLLERLRGVNRSQTKKKLKKTG